MDNDSIADLFRSIGEVTIKRMFGGKGIYIHGTIVAIELRGELMLKGDEQAGALYEEAGSTRWRYTHNKSGKAVAMPYWTLPSAALDDVDEMDKWARVAAEAAYRSAPG